MAAYYGDGSALTELPCSCCVEYTGWIQLQEYNINNRRMRLKLLSGPIWPHILVLKSVSDNNKLPIEYFKLEFHKNKHFQACSETNCLFGGHTYHKWWNNFNFHKNDHWRTLTQNLLNSWYEKKNTHTWTLI